MVYYMVCYVVYYLVLYGILCGILYGIYIWYYMISCVIIIMITMILMIITIIMTIIYDNDHILHIHDDDDDDEEEEEQPSDWHRLRMMKIESVRRWDRIGDGDMDSMKGLARQNEDFTIKKPWITQWIKDRKRLGSDLGCATKLL